MSRRITTSIQWIGAAQAEEMLGANSHNRSLRPAYVRKLAGDMKDGRWVFTGAPIVLDEKDRLLDGQHRLQAIIESGTTVQMVVISGVPETSQEMMDCGRRRSVADALTLRGVPRACVQASIAKFLWLWLDHGTIDHKGVWPTNAEVLDVFDHLKGLQDIANPVADTAAASATASGPLGAVIWIGSKINADKAGYLLEKLHTGENLARTDPVYKLREALFKNAKNARRVTLAHQSAWIVKTLNNLLSGKPTAHLMYHPGVDLFPQIEGDETARASSLKAVGMKRP